MGTEMGSGAAPQTQQTEVKDSGNLWKEETNMGMDVQEILVLLVGTRLQPAIPTPFPPHSSTEKKTD